MNDIARIDPAEHRARQRRLGASLAERDADGALVFSRGGSTYDRYANVFYLTGHYQHYSYLPEFPPTFSGRAHCAAVVTADGATTLCISTPELDETMVAADRVRCGDTFIGTVIDAVRDAGLADARLCLVGADVLPTNLWIALAEGLPGVRWRHDDAPLLALRRIKSPAEQRLIRAAAAINRRAVTAFLEALRPGVTEAEAVAEAVRVICAAGAGLYYAAVSSGPKSWAWMSSPLPGYSTRRLQAGEIVRLDLGMVYAGYLSDFGRTAVVGAPSADQQYLLDVLHGALDAAIGAARSGGTVGDVVRAGDGALASAGVVSDDRAGPGAIVASYPAHWGHCLGLGWERPWLVEAESQAHLVPGMYVAIERALTLEGVGTVAAEQNVLITDDGHEILTLGADKGWD